MPRFYLRGVSYVCENKGILYFVYIYFEVDMQNKSKEFSFYGNYFELKWISSIYCFGN